MPCTCRTAIKQIKAAPIDAQLSKQVSDDQASARTAFLAILGSIRYLARQGVAMRDHIEEQGNLMQLLTLRAQDISVLPAVRYTTSLQRNNLLTYV